MVRLRVWEKHQLPMLIDVYSLLLIYHNIKHVEYLHSKYIPVELNGIGAITNFKHKMQYTVSTHFLLVDQHKA